jgi:hypothetical protein
MLSPMKFAAPKGKKIIVVEETIERVAPTEDKEQL